MTIDLDVAFLICTVLFGISAVGHCAAAIFFRRKLIIVYLVEVLVVGCAFQAIQWHRLRHTGIYLELIAIMCMAILDRLLAVRYEKSLWAGIFEWSATLKHRLQVKQEAKRR